MDDDLLAEIERELLAWTGVCKEVLSADPTMETRQTAVTVFRYGRRHLGHIHHDGVADVQLTRSVHGALVAAGEAAPHRGGFAAVVSHDVRAAADVPAVVALFRRSYEMATNAAAERLAARGTAGPAAGDARAGPGRP